MGRRRGLRSSMIATIAALIGVMGLAPTDAHAYWWIHQAWNLDVCMDNYARTGDVWQYTCNPQENQQWTWDQSAPTWIVLKEKRNGVTLCLTAAGPYEWAPVKAVDCSRDGYRAWNWVRGAWGERFNEYVIQLDGTFLCIWGSVEYGLVTPLYLRTCDRADADFLWEPIDRP